MAEPTPSSDREFVERSRRLGRRLWRSAYIFDLLLVGAVVCVGMYVNPKRPPPIFGRWTYDNRYDGDVVLTLMLLPIAAAVLRVTGSALAQRKLGLSALVVLSVELLFVTFATPIRSRSREVANRKQCISHLTQIGEAIGEHARQHGGTAPRQFADLLAAGAFAPGVFVCPSSMDKPARGDTLEALLGDFASPKHCSYVYRAASAIDPIPKDHVVAHDAPKNHHGDGMHVLYGDGTIDWVPEHSTKWVLLGLSAGIGPDQASSATQRSPE